MYCCFLGLLTKAEHLTGIREKEPRWGAALKPQSAHLEIVETIAAGNAPRKHGAKTTDASDPVCPGDKRIHRRSPQRPLWHYSINDGYDYFVRRDLPLKYYYYGRQWEVITRWHCGLVASRAPGWGR